MSYSGSMQQEAFYMVASGATQLISAGLFEKAYSKQPIFHNDNKMPSLGGNTAIIFSVALQADADTSYPTASISVLNSDSITSRAGSQIATSTYASQRSYQSTNPIITTKSNIELSVNILDSGDQVYLDSAVFLIMPIKD